MKLPHTPSSPLAGRNPLSKDLSRRTVLVGSAGGAVLAATAGPLAAAAVGPYRSLSSPVFDFRIDQATGGVFTLVNPTDQYATNHVSNPDLRPEFDLDDSRWTGDAVFGVKRGASTAIAPAITGLSDDIRTVTSTASSITVAYSGQAGNQYGIRGFDLTQKYELTGAARDRISWTMTLRNTSTESLEFVDVGLPFLMNSWWDGSNQTGIYEKNVARHSFVAKDGSYLYWQRPNGEGPFLVLAPQDGTSLEFKNKARPGEGPFGERDPQWEGLVEFYIHSAGSVPQRRNQAGTYLPTTSLVLAPGQEKTYGFTFRWAADYADLRDVLFDAGVVDVVSLPGMVIPQDQKATLAVRAKSGITSVVGQAGRNITVTPQGERNGYSLFELSLPQLGASTVTVTYGGTRESVLQYYAIEPVEKLIGLHSAFLTSKQQARTTRGYDGAFLQWDLSNQKLITWDDYPGGGWKEWMAGGSDDLGLAPAAFLAEKNLVAPVKAEIDAIDYYIDNFLLGYLQGKKNADGTPTYQVFRWYDGRDDTPNDQGVWRVYNYIHVANTYFAMHRIAAQYPSLGTARSSAEYLELTYRTLEAMYTKVPLPTPIGDAAREHGLMGEQTYPFILEALRSAGRTTEADRLRTLIEGKRDVLFAEKYPFRSEISIDTTGFESTYTLGKMYGNRELVDRVQRSSLACRGLQPLWYFYGSDNRHMGESWWNLSYECQLGAWQQHDYLVNYASTADRDFADATRSTYGAYLAGWANINSGQISPLAANIGAASWIYQSEKGANEYGWMPILDGWWAWSGESALGFWGGVRAATVTVVEDPIVGTYAYGADLTTVGTSSRVVPKDGVRQRLTMFTRGGFRFEITGARYSRADVANDLGTIELVLDRPAGVAGTPAIVLSKLPAGRYTVTVDGVSTGQPITSDGATARLALPGLAAATATVRLVRETTAPVGPVVAFETSATSRCLTAKSILTVKVTNRSTGPIDAVVTSAYGTKSFTAIAAGKSASVAFTTRQSSMPAGEVSVVGTGTVSGQRASTTQTTAYASRSC
ncbi:hypothetical protein ASF48_01380 [Rathayibacter sp. Leaf299]|uniref:DUF5695 domain-containing protein n=1 Tax=Rathayibacter sp. Leaf299 TaxID=1736328 RepID=UPI0006FF5912|nr:DUF5695 domain-containing protein [Rathayibacter sp. Leaf299]KQQ21925.1 hypothetical protein ASF48_01380 [Rathayibacter sp. Leaf299]